MEKTYWKRTKWESPELVLENVILFRSLTSRDPRTQFATRGFFKKNPDPFIRIDKVCQELGISSKFYFDVMYSSPVGKGGALPFATPFLNFLGSPSGRVTFLGRIDKYQQRLGAMDDIGEYVATKSIANMETWFGGSFTDGYWLFHRFFDQVSSVSIDESFIIFEDSPEFTNMFIITHPYWQTFLAENGRTSLASSLKKRCAGESDIIRMASLGMGFYRARVLSRTKAQNYLERRRDERWDAVWKILG